VENHFANFGYFYELPSFSFNSSLDCDLYEMLDDILSTCGDIAKNKMIRSATNSSSDGVRVFGFIEPLVKEIHVVFFGKMFET